MGLRPGLRAFRLGRPWHFGAEPVPVPRTPAPVPGPICSTVVITPADQFFMGWGYVPGCGPSDWDGLGTLGQSLCVVDAPRQVTPAPATPIPDTFAPPTRVPASVPAARRGLSVGAIVAIVVGCVSAVAGLGGVLLLCRANASSQKQQQQHFQHQQQQFQQQQLQQLQGGDPSCDYALVQ
eukprot:TRINITY_DN7173_c0_g1_i2.p1 TRINITY_DN7173_c0_g1~~TRINITY_DN7173_c0_g1_i2.p1  ORF type:complete len:180 (+),score=32.32 TRINITY_DN7173_c0_g1_i2:205-744(+)